MTDHEHRYAFDRETERLAMRAAAAHYYEHQFDWRALERQLLAPVRG